MDDREVKGRNVLPPRQRVQILQDALRFQPVTAERMGAREQGAEIGSRREVDGLFELLRSMP